MDWKREPVLLTWAVLAHNSALSVAKVWDKVTIRLPGYAIRERFNTKASVLYTCLHAGVFLVPFTFSRAGGVLFLIVYFLSTLGVTMGYHRLLTHRSYQTFRWLKYSLAFLAVLALQRGPIWWVATHRLHHSQVDTELDPHTPMVSFAWSHFLWGFFKHPQLDESDETVYRLARDIAEDPGMRFLEKYYTIINVGFLMALFAAGFCLGGFKLGLSFFIWAGLFRAVVSLNVTWFVNSAAHLWGYRSYRTDDTSRNNWWVALLSFGEGWHNNHHADQRAARNGHRWFEIDMTYYIIAILRRCGLVFQVVPLSPRLENPAFKL